MQFCKGVLVFVVLCLLGYTLGDSDSSSVPETNTLGRARRSFFGLFSSCKGCPEHFCDDDPAVIRGYCCGCSHGVLPIRCPPSLSCPLNTYSICQDFDYMIKCCC